MRSRVQRWSRFGLRSGGRLSSITLVICHFDVAELLLLVIGFGRAGAVRVRGCLIIIFVITDQARCLIRFYSVRTEVGGVVKTIGINCLARDVKREVEVGRRLRSGGSHLVLGLRFVGGSVDTLAALSSLRGSLCCGHPHRLASRRRGLTGLLGWVTRIFRIRLIIRQATKIDRGLRLIHQLAQIQAEPTLAHEGRQVRSRRRGQERRIFLGLHGLC